MTKETVNLLIINELKSRGIFIGSISPEVLNCYANLMYKQFSLNSVVKWIAIESNIKPVLNDENILVRYKSGRSSEVFLGDDFRFYDLQDKEDVTDYVMFWAKMP